MQDMNINTSSSVTEIWFSLKCFNLGPQSTITNKKHVKDGSDEMIAFALENFTSVIKLITSASYYTFCFELYERFYSETFHPWQLVHPNASKTTRILNNIGPNSIDDFQKLDIAVSTDLHYPQLLTLTTTLSSLQPSYLNSSFSCYNSAFIIQKNV